MCTEDDRVMTECWKRVVIVAALEILPASDVRAQACPSYTGPGVTGALANQEVDEASGLVASRRNPGILWTHNDSGNSNRVYAVGRDGSDLGTFILSGATNVDWEDIAIGRGPDPGVEYLYVGDIGDNLNIRPTVRVYRVSEPAVMFGVPSGMATLGAVLTLTLAYPDGPRDAETLMVDVNGDLYIVSKRVTAHGRVYRAAYPQATSGVIEMEYVGEIPWGAVNGAGGATGGDIAPDGSAIVVRRGSQYSPAATLWRREPGESIAQAIARAGCDVTLPSEPQGEAIAFSPDDLSLYTVSEGVHPPIHALEQEKAPGDVDGDAAVNIDDLLRVIAAWGRCPSRPLPCVADLDDTGAVDIDDLLLVISHWDP